MAMDRSRRNEIAYIVLRNIAGERGLITLKDKPMDFEEMAKDVGGGVSPEEAARILWGSRAEASQ